MRLIIGVGNPLRRDDGAGAIVARRVGRIRPDVCVLTVQQLLPEHAESIRAADMVVVVDAAVGVAPGQVTCARVTPADTPRADHACGPADILALTRRLYGVTPESWLVQIGAEALHVGSGLSSAVRTAVPRAVVLASELLSSPRVTLSGPANPDPRA